MFNRGRRLGLAAVFLVATLPLSMPGGATSVDAKAPAAATRQPASEDFEQVACPFALPSDQEEGREVSCGYLTVPEFHDEPDGLTIELLVVIYESTARRPAQEPLVLLLGGPGQEVAAVLPAFSESSPINYLPLLEQRDVVILEQRGIGYSRPSLACPFDAVAGQEPVDGAAVLAESVEAYVDCANDLRDAGIDLDAYATVQSAADVDHLRAALGYDRVDLLGISYGSKLALTVMRDFPDAVRSAVLASPLPLQANVLAGQIIAFDRSLKRLFAACDVDPRCGNDFPDLQSAFSTAVARLDNAPISLAARNPLTGADLDLVIDGQSFIRVVYVATFVGLLLPFVPEMISSVANGEVGSLELMAPFSAIFGVGISYGANVVYNCKDEFAFTDAEDVAALIAEADVMPELAGGEFAGTYDAFEVCDELNLAAPALRENRPARSEVPALVVAGEYDPITPPAYAELAAQTLPNSHVVVLPGLGHDPITTGGDCSLNIVIAFLDEPGATPDTTCAERLGLAFVV